MVIRSAGANRIKGICKAYKAFPQRWELVVYKGLSSEGYMVSTDAPTVQRLIDTTMEYHLSIGKLCFSVWFELDDDNVLVRLEHYNYHVEGKQSFSVPYKPNGNMAHTLVEWACRKYPTER